MAKVEYLNERDAPAPPKPLSKAAALSLEILKGIKDGQVAKVTPDDEGQTLRGLKSSISRVAKSHGMKVEAYESAEFPGSLYVKKLK